MRDESEVRAAIKTIETSIAILNKIKHTSDIAELGTVIDALKYALGSPSRLAFSLIKAQKWISEYEAECESR